MLSRRSFLKSLVSFFAALFCAPLIKKQENVYASLGKKTSTVSVIKGKDKKALVRNVLKPFGGIERWVQPGKKVVIKPNAAWSRTPEEAANVHPDILQGIIEMCYDAGAGRVDVIEHSCDNPISAFDVNGLEKAVRKTKSRIRALGDDNDFLIVDVPRGKRLKKVDVAKEILDADVYINVPIAKTHGAAILTLGMKNHMGAVKNRWYFHMNDLHQCIADVSTVLQPDIIIVDATRIMTSKGPKGPGDVKVLDTLIAGVDQVAVDSYAASLFGYNGRDIGHILKAYEHGLGEIELSNIDIQTVAI